MIITCPSCRVGRLGERAMTYIEWHGKVPLVTTNMPALVCDFCGDRVYDNQAIENLHQLLWSERPKKRSRTIPNPG